MAGKAERVVITGMGVASPLGCNLVEFWDGLLAGKPGVGSLDGSIFSGLHTFECSLGFTESIFAMQRPRR
jgi:3-oxoacyl-[acyl-carrier-protein] synthase II